MDQNALVSDELEAGRRLIDELRDTGFEVAAAFWAKSSEEGSWYLYIASPTVDEKGSGAAYLPVHAALRRMPELGIDLFDVRVVSPTDSMAAAAIEVTKPKVPSGPFAVPNPRPYPGITRFGGTSLGGVSVDGAYLYPPAPAVTTP